MTVSRWGYHLIIDAARCMPQNIRCPTNIERFSKTLVERIEMVPYGKPQIVMFGSGNKKVIHLYSSLKPQILLDIL